jgi:hypothetical protein
MSQADNLYKLLSDYRPHRTDEILRVVYGSQHLGIARIGARVADLKKGRHSRKAKCDITGWRDKEVQGLYWYRMAGKVPVLPEPFKATPISSTPGLFNP